MNPSGIVDWLLGGRWLTYTWATKPSAAGWTGRTIRITDIGATTIGSLWSSDGTRWRPVNGHVVLGSSALAASCGNDTTEDTLATITVPAGAMGPNGQLRVTWIYSFTNSANSKNLRTRFSGIGGTQYFAATRTANASEREQIIIQNAGATNSQKGWIASSTFGVSTAALTTSSVDTDAADTTVVITGAKGLNTETLTLEQYCVELLVP